MIATAAIGLGMLPTGFAEELPSHVSPDGKPPAVAAAPRLLAPIDSTSVERPIGFAGATTSSVPTNQAEAAKRDAVHRPSPVHATIGSSQREATPSGTSDDEHLAPITPLPARIIDGRPAAIRPTENAQFAPISRSPAPIASTPRIRSQLTGSISAEKANFAPLTIAPVPLAVGAPVAGAPVAGAPVVGGRAAASFAGEMLNYAPITNAPAPVVPGASIAPARSAESTTNDMPNLAPIRSAASAPAATWSEPDLLSDAIESPGRLVPVRSAESELEDVPYGSDTRPPVQGIHAETDALIPDALIPDALIPEAAPEDRPAEPLVAATSAPVDAEAEYGDAVTDPGRVSPSTTVASDPLEIGGWVPGSDNRVPLSLVDTQPPAPVRPGPPAGVEHVDSMPIRISEAAPRPIGDSSADVSRQPSLARQASPEIFHIPHRKSLQVRTESEVRRLEVEDSRICETLQFAPGEISIVGKQQGETRLAVWLTGTRDPVIWCVRVGSETKPRTEVQSDAALKRLVIELYPQSRIKLTSTEDKLIVEGWARDRQEAVQILSFIRGVRLIPVVDRLTVPSR